MATWGVINGSCSANTTRYFPKLYWKQISQSIENNTTTIRVYSVIQNDGSTYDFNGTCSSWSLTCNGVTRTLASFVSNSDSGWTYPSGWTDGSNVVTTNKTELIPESGTTYQDFTITHNADGTKTASISHSYSLSSGGWGPGNVSISGSIVLNTIPRASTPRLSASSTVMGSNLTIYTDRVSTAFTHTITYSFGTASGTVGSNVGDSYVWTVPLSLVSQTATSGTITLTTYSGGVNIGSKSVTFYLTKPSLTTPSLNYSTREMGQTIRITTNPSNSALSHKIYYAFTGIGKTLLKTTATGNTYYDWLIPIETLASKIPTTSSGTVTIYADTYYGGTLIGSKTATFTATKPAGTTPSLSHSTIDMGSNISITVTPAYSSFTHKIYYSFTGISKTLISTESAGTKTKVWTVPLATLAPQIPNNTSGTVMIYADTYEGSTLIGSKTATFTATVPSTVIPTATITITPVDQYNGYYVRTKSKVQVSIVATGAYGSSISSYSTVVNGVNYTTASFTTGVLNTKDLNSIIPTIKDSRNREVDKATITRTITVVDYANPSASNLTAVRCDASGNPLQTGIYMKLVASGSISPINNTNTKSALIRYRAVGASTWEQGAPVDPALPTDTTYSPSYSVIIPADGSTRFEVEFVVSDYYTSATKTALIPTAFVLVNYHESGLNVAFGKVSEGLALIEAKGNILVDGNIDVNAVTISRGGDLILQASVGSVDSGDLVFRDGSGAELHRVWAGTGTLNYRTAGGTSYAIWHSGNDGSGSGLDADLLDGYHVSTSAASANTIPVRDASGYMYLGWINTPSGSVGNVQPYYVYCNNTTSTDNFIRKIPFTDLANRINAYGSASNSHTHSYAPVSHTHSTLNATTWNRSQTSSGYIDFGPANTGTAHIYTDRPSFYFNKPLLVSGVGVWTTTSLRFRGGRVQVAPTANSPTYASVSYGETFPAEPVLQATGYSSVPYSELRMVSITSPTTTSCRVYVYRTNTTDTGVWWSAMYR